MDDDRYRYRDIPAKHGGTLRLRDDGYRIEVQWRDCPARNVDPEEWTLWAEYKQCNLPAIGFDVADFLMAEEAKDTEAKDTALDTALGALADIATSEDMTLEIARKKAKRVYAALSTITPASVSRT